MGTQAVVDVRPQHPHAIALADAAAFLGLATPRDAGRLLTGVAAASSFARPGDLFAALPGLHVHGAEFADDALNRGAAAVLTDVRGAALLGGLSAPVLVVPDPRLVLGPLSAHIYGNDAVRPTALGVTGTNGKTTVVYYMEALLRHAGHVTGLSATPERHVGTTIVGSGLTTPEAPVLQGMIARMRELGADALVLEVSAQAVSNHRIDGVHFDAVGFLNLSAEHLDEYGTIEAYYQAKRGLFLPEHARRAVVALADEWCTRLVDETPLPVETLTTSWWDRPGEWIVDGYEDVPEGCRCTVTGPDGHRHRARLGLPGRHVAVDAGMAIALVRAAGVPSEAIDAALDDDVLLEPYVPGRMERVSGEGAPLVIVDYGHTPVAMADTLRAIRRRTKGRLITAFGADGGRDPFKRPGMARAAAENADVVLICDAHPRTEDPAGIRAELLAAARGVGKAEVREVPDPATAIREAVAMLRPGDAFVVLGPGDEDYRAVGTVEIPYSARAECRAALAAKGWAVRPVPRRTGETQ